MVARKAPRRIEISKRCFDAIARLPTNARTALNECLTKLRQDSPHPSLNYEAIKTAADPRMRSIRVNEQYRAIVTRVEDGNAPMLLWVDKHDDAYAWAARHKLDTENDLDGLAIVEIRERQEEAALPTPFTLPASPAEQGIFQTYAEEQLIQAGIPKYLLPALKACKTDDEVEALLLDLPRPLADRVLEIWTGEPLTVPVNQSLEEEPAQPSTAMTVSEMPEAQVHRPESSRHFIAISSEEELKQALKYPLELWRIFLHPEQRDIVRADFDGPALVSGGAGTGKTVVGLHRARYLAAEVFTAPGDRVLLTTYTNNLAQDLEALIDSLCESQPDVRQRIDVQHVHSLAKRIRSLARESFDAPKDGEDLFLMQQAVRQHNPLNLPAAFYLTEWEDVAQERDALTEEAYLLVNRAGRGRALIRRQRAEVWQVFEVYRSKLAASGKEEWPSVMRRARELIETGRAQLPYHYRAVIVDEAQDMGAQEMRLLLALVGQGSNSVLLLGDTRQQIYRRGSYLQLLNIAIGPRHRELQLNYRTTEQIHTAAAHVLTSGTTLAGEALGTDKSISLLQGPHPLIQSFANEMEEEAAVVAQIQETLAVMQPEEVVVVARTNAALTRYAGVLRAAGIPNAKIERGPRGPGVQLATMHRVKGLEFRAVFIVHCSVRVVPQPKRGDVDDDAARKDHEERERRLLYVAMTRARELLWISSVGQPSPFLAR